MIKVGILGASGYTGLELIRILLNHPHIKIFTITSEKYSGNKISDVFPSFKGHLDLKYEALSPEEVSKKCDFVFSALPHKASMSAVPPLLKAGKKVVDLSADFRFKSSSTYKDWYKEEHKNPELLNSAVYGLPELKRERNTDRRVQERDSSSRRDKKECQSIRVSESQSLNI